MKNMIKTALVIMMVALIGFSFAACGGGGGPGEVTIPSKYHDTWNDADAVLYVVNGSPYTEDVVVEISASEARWKVNGDDTWHVYGPFVDGGDDAYFTSLDDYTKGFVTIRPERGGLYIDMGHNVRLTPSFTSRIEMSGIFTANGIAPNDPGDFEGTWKTTVDGATVTATIESTGGCIINVQGLIQYEYRYDYHRTSDDSAVLYRYDDNNEITVGTMVLQPPNSVKFVFNENANDSGTYTLTKQ